MGNIQRYTIISMDRSVPETCIFRMEPVEGVPLKFTPGQFVMIHALDDLGNSVEKRPYSLASSPGKPYLEFCIRMLHGKFTSMLERMGLGDQVGIEGPFGHFGYNGESRAAFIGGGTGIAPLMSMLRHIADSRKSGTFVVFYSSKTRDSVLYADELERLEKANPGIKVVVTLTRESPSGWEGECGRINEDMIRKYTGGPKGFAWWLCGPKELVGVMKECLLSIGVDPKDIRIEGWG